MPSGVNGGWVPIHLQPSHPVNGSSPHAKSERFSSTTNGHQQARMKRGPLPPSTAGSRLPRPVRVELRGMPRVSLPICVRSYHHPERFAPAAQISWRQRRAGGPRRQRRRGTVDVRFLLRRSSGEARRTCDCLRSALVARQPRQVHAWCPSTSFRLRTTGPRRKRGKRMKTCVFNG